MLSRIGQLWRVGSRSRNLWAQMRLGTSTTNVLSTDSHDVPIAGAAGTCRPARSWLGTILQDEFSGTTKPVHASLLLQSHRLVSLQALN
jgi:hypothetical protein